MLNVLGYYLSILPVSAVSMQWYENIYPKCMLTQIVVRLFLKTQYSHLSQKYMLSETLTLNKDGWYLHIMHIFLQLLTCMPNHCTIYLAVYNAWPEPENYLFELQVIYLTLTLNRRTDMVENFALHIVSMLLTFMPSHLKIPHGQRTFLFLYPPKDTQFSAQYIIETPTWAVWIHHCSR